jgi:hypothetical protein
MQRQQVRGLAAERRSVIDELDGELAIDEVQLHDSLDVGRNGSTSATINGRPDGFSLYHACLPVNPEVPLLILGHAPGTQAVEVVPRSELERIEARWSARFVAVPRGAAPLTFPDYSSEVVAEVERLLERARTEGAALAEDEAQSALSEVERVLHAHPELPQAAWLMAERHELGASLAERTRATDPREQHLRARALEPERAATFGQEPAPLAQELPVFRLAIRGPERRDQLEWDGAERTFPADVRPGEHQLRVLRDGALIWAGWVSVAATRPVLELDADRSRRATCAAPPGPCCGSSGAARRSRCAAARAAALGTPPPRS